MIIRNRSTKPTVHYSRISVNEQLVIFKHPNFYDTVPPDSFEVTFIRIISRIDFPEINSILLRGVNNEGELFSSAVLITKPVSNIVVPWFKADGPTKREISAHSPYPYYSYSDFNRLNKLSQNPLNDKEIEMLELECMIKYAEYRRSHSRIW